MSTSTTFTLDPETDIRNQHGAVSWLELVSSEPETAAETIGQTIGWEFETFNIEGSDYLVGKVAGHGVGGIRTPMPGEPSPRWVTYVAVDDAAAFARAGEEQGGEVAIPPTQLGDVGTMVVVSHPHLGQLAGFQYNHPFA